MAAESCPCGSGTRYGACCRPYHRGEKEAESCERLVRTRFAAYAFKEIDYVWKTLHAEHDDKQRDEASVKRVLLAGANSLKFVKLHILDAEERGRGETSRVLFAAEIFEKGRERSFIEASQFQHDGQGFRYLRGEQAPFKGEKALAGLTLKTFAPLPMS